MPRALFILAFLLVAAGVAQSSDVRYRLRVHVFYDDGLRIEESKFTYGSQIACDRAGEKEQMRFARKNIIAPFYCTPVHYLLNTGGWIT